MDGPYRYPISETHSYSRGRLHTGEIMESTCRAQLKKVMRRRLEQLDLMAGIKNFDAYFQNAICEALAPDRAACECKYVDQDAPAALQKERVIGVGDLRRFLATVRAHVANGGTYVPQEEAERRALICSQCVFNQDISGCFGCTGIVNEIFELLGKATTKYDDNLRGCAVCACELKTKVHMPSAVLDAGGDNFSYAPHCWRNAEQSSNSASPGSTPS